MKQWLIHKMDTFGAGPAELLLLFLPLAAVICGMVYDLFFRG